MFFVVFCGRSASSAAVRGRRSAGRVGQFGLLTILGTVSAGFAAHSLASDCDNDGIQNNEIITVIAPLQFSFPTQPFLDIGSRPRACVSADFNGDGLLDVATANWFTRSVSIMSNVGNCVFYRTAELFPSTELDFKPIDITSADFDGDGATDLAIANDGLSGGSRLVVVKFATLESDEYEMNGRQAGVATADFDLDGDFDLAVTLPELSLVRILLNDGSGTFSTSANLQFAVTKGRLLVAMDMDQDGAVDLAVADEFGRAAILRNLGGVGPAWLRFGAAQLVNVGLNPVAIAAGDLNRDGLPDIAISTQSNTVAVLIQDNATPGLDFLTAFGSPYPVIGQPTWLRLADLNADGDLDLVVGNINASNPGRISVLTNSGVRGRDALGVASVFYETTAMAPRSIDLSSACNGSAAACLTPRSFAIEDFDFDGKPDLLVGLESTNRFTVIRNLSLPPPYAKPDRNSNGIPDDCVAEPGTDCNNNDVPDSYEKSAQQVGFEFVNQLPVGEMPSALLSVDIDLDGAADALVANKDENTITVQLNASRDGSFVSAPGSPYTVGSGPAALAAADLNGDGFPDVVTANSGGGSASVLLNNGSGSLVAAVAYAVGATPSGVVLLDVDSDVDRDVVVANAGSNNLSILLNNGAGGFSAGGTVPVGAGPRGVAAADVDHDGILDLAVANSDAGSVTILRGNGAGSFGLPATISVGSVTSDPIALAFLDFDLDGDADLAVLAQGAAQVVFLRNVGATFSSAGFATLAGTPNSLAVGDLDQDGDPDLVVAHDSPELMTVTVLRNDSRNGSFVGLPFVSENPGDSAAIALSDAVDDGGGIGLLDGRLDMLLTGRVESDDDILSIFRFRARLGPLTVTWVGPNNTTWDSDARWCPAVYPDNERSDPWGGEFTAIIGQPQNVTVQLGSGFNPKLSQLDLHAGSKIQSAGSNGLRVAESIQNDGNIHVTGNNTTFALNCPEVNQGPAGSLESVSSTSTASILQLEDCIVRGGSVRSARADRPVRMVNSLLTDLTLARVRVDALQTVRISGAITADDQTSVEIAGTLEGSTDADVTIQRNGSGNLSLIRPGQIRSSGGRTMTLRTPISVAAGGSGMATLVAGGGPVIVEPPPGGPIDVDCIDIPPGSGNVMDLRSTSASIVCRELEADGGLAIVSGTGFPVTVQSEVVVEPSTINDIAELRLRAGTLVKAADALIGKAGNPPSSVGGVLSGSGELEMTGALPLLVDGGVLRPGDTDNDRIGTLAIRGNLTQVNASGAKLQIELAPSNRFDRVTLLGANRTAAIAGTLEVSAVSGHTPTVGQIFTILSATTVSGQFQTVSTGNFPPGLGVSVVYHPNRVDIQIVSACEPCDTNCDGSVNQFDILPFVTALATQSGCSPCAADSNLDGSINQFDITGFVECLGG